MKSNRSRIRNYLLSHCVEGGGGRGGNVSTSRSPNHVCLKCACSVIYRIYVYKRNETYCQRQNDNNDRNMSLIVSD